MIATAPTFDTGHPAIARIRCYFDAFHHSDSHDYAGQWTYPAGLFADGQWVAVPDAAASYLVVRLATPGREPEWKVAVCLMGR
jgi:hypothetical protein